MIGHTDGSVLNDGSEFPGMLTSPSIKPVRISDFYCLVLGVICAALADTRYPLLRRSTGTWRLDHGFSAGPASRSSTQMLAIHGLSMAQPRAPTSVAPDLVTCS